MFWSEGTFGYRTYSNVSNSKPMPLKHDFEIERRRYKDTVVRNTFFILYEYEFLEKPMLLIWK